MNKLIFSLLGLMVCTLSLNAQIEPSKAFKKAKKAYSTYLYDSANNEASLTEAKDMMGIAMESEEVKADFMAWELQTQICNSLIQADFGKYQAGLIENMSSEADGCAAATSSKASHLCRKGRIIRFWCVGTSNSQSIQEGCFQRRVCRPKRKKGQRQSMQDNKNDYPKNKLCPF